MPKKRNNKVIQAMRKPYCEYCGRVAHGEPHHIFTRGAGGQDIPENLIQLCGGCHIAVHSGHIDRDELLELVAVRQGMDYEELYRLNRRAMGYNV